MCLSIEAGIAEWRLFYQPGKEKNHPQFPQGFVISYLFSGFKVGSKVKIAKLMKENIDSGQNLTDIDFSPLISLKNINAFRASSSRSAQET